MDERAAAGKDVREDVGSDDDQDEDRDREERSCCVPIGDLQSRS